MAKPGQTRNRTPKPIQIINDQLLPGFHMPFWTRKSSFDSIIPSFVPDLWSVLRLYECQKTELINTITTSSFNGLSSSLRRFFVFGWKLESLRQTDCVNVEGDEVELIRRYISESCKLERAHDCPHLHRLSQLSRILTRRVVWRSAVIGVVDRNIALNEANVDRSRGWKM